MRTKLLTLFCLVSFSASAATFTGWISDATCGAGNASSKSEARSCAESCIKAGAPPVFVTDTDHKVFKIADASKVKDHLKGKVKVTGSLKGDTLTITQIEDVKE
jgi:hypothetical protein